MNAPIRYFGGKGTMRAKLYELFPVAASYNTFIDGFGGSGTILLGQERPNKTEIYNDLEQNVYSLYKVLQNPELFANFKSRAELSYYSEQLRLELRNKLKEELDVVERAYCFWYVNRTSVNSIGGFSEITVTRRGISKSTSDFLSNIEGLDKLHQRLQTVIIKNDDIFNILTKYNKNDVFFYLDPPYHHSTRTSSKVYTHEFTSEQHVKLVEILSGTNAKVMLSGYHIDEYDKLLDLGWTKGTLEGKAITKECVWINYENK